MAGDRSDTSSLEQHIRQASKEAEAAAEGSPNWQRATSWCDAQQRLRQAPELQRRRLLSQPGGFRRDFLHRIADEQGVPQERRPLAWTASLLTSLKLDVRAYGLLLDDEDEAEEAIRSSLQVAVLPDAAERPAAPPRTLLSNSGVLLAIFKANCGCAVLYMPRAWRNGGYAISAAAFPAIGILAIVGSLRLLRCRSAYHGSYGELVERAGGPYAGYIINACIILQQSGTCCSYFIVAGKLIKSVFLPHVSIKVMILLQLLLCVPLAFIRNVAKLWPLTMVGTLLVVLGIFATLGLEGAQFLRSGAEAVEAANTSSFLVCLGTATFMFEGIGLVVPTYDSSADPSRFPLVFTLAMLLVLVMVSAVGSLGYLTYGPGTESLILLNFPQGVFQGVLRMAFVIQIFCSFPLQLLPAVRLVEDRFIRKVPNPSMARKCGKSAFRGLYVCLLAGIAVVGATSLDNFVSLIGAVCGIPLSFVFPAICHFYLGGRTSTGERLIDIGLIVFGMGLLCAVTAVNIQAWATNASQ